MSALYFIAIVAPEEIGLKVNRWKHWMRDNFGCRAALRSPAHITLVPPFRMEPESEVLLNPALNNFAARRESFDISLNGFDSFGRKVIFVQVDHNPALNECYNELNHFLQQEVPGLITVDTRPYHPHVTIATRDIPPGAFRTAIQHFETITYSASMKADRISLLKLSTAKWEIIHESAMHSSQESGQ